MGRNAKPYGTKLVMTSVRMSPTIKRRLEALSEESGYTMQEHIRRALMSTSASCASAASSRAILSSAPKPATSRRRRPGVSVFEEDTA